MKTKLQVYKVSRIVKKLEKKLTENEQLRKKMNKKRNCIPNTKKKNFRKS